MSTRELFASRFGVVMTMIGVAVGLGNVWRFPYLVGRYGGTAFVIVYALVAVLICVPALMGEWALGRHARRGTVGAFAAAGVPRGQALGWLLFAVVVAATAYYTNVVGWVLFYAVGQVASRAGVPWDSARVIPPSEGFSTPALALQVVSTGVVILGCALVLARGLRRGIERASRVIMPALFGILLLLIARSLTLDGAADGLRWYVGRMSWADLTPTVVVAALGQAVFSASLGGTFMVTYGSYLGDDADLGRNAATTIGGDLLAGLLAGFAIFPAVFALGLEPGSGPALLFDTIPRVFAQMPLGWLFGLLFFAGLFGAAWLSDIAAFEVLVAGLTDNTRVTRRAAVWWMAGLVFLVSLVPMINLAVFLRWDLTFGSGMQTFGALAAALTAGWAMQRGALLQQIGGNAVRGWRRLIPFWLRFVVPGAILAVGVWWLLSDVLRVIGSV